MYIGFLFGVVVLLLGLAMGGCSLYWTLPLLTGGAAAGGLLLFWFLGFAVGGLCIWGGYRLMTLPAPGDPPR